MTKPAALDIRWEWWWNPVLESLGLLLSGKILKVITKFLHRKKCHKSLILHIKIIINFNKQTFCIW